LKILTYIFILLLGDGGDFLILSLSIIGKPSSNLFLCQPCLLCQSCLVILLQIGVVDIVEKPFLQDLGLMLLKRLPWHLFHCFCFRLCGQSLMRTFLIKIFILLISLRELMPGLVSFSRSLPWRLKLVILVSVLRGTVRQVFCQLFNV